MAKFRLNHNRGKNPFIGLTVRLFLMMVVLVGLFFVLRNYSFGADSEAAADEIDILFDGNQREYLIPGNNEYDVVHHTYYSLGYDEQAEQARWVSYILKEDELRIPNVPRAKRFEIDPYVLTGSAKHNDYSHSGYTRGHLAPAGDMAFSKKAMAESFYMSNMSPQLRAFNGGIWRELEETVRDWAYSDGQLYVVTGPVLKNDDPQIGKSNKINAPTEFYKVLLDISGKSTKGIGFILPNEQSEKPLREYAVTIDIVEEVVGLDFYRLLMDDETEEQIESTINLAEWPFSKKRENLRINRWNKN